MHEPIDIRRRQPHSRAVTGQQQRIRSAWPESSLDPQTVASRRAQGVDGEGADHVI
jgi:hypothetical protein